VQHEIVDRGFGFAFYGSWSDGINALGASADADETG
jgi:hypothetical protein